VRMAPQSNQSTELAVEFPTAFLLSWLESHARQGEETHVTVRGTATFMVLQRPIDVPYHWEGVWSTRLAQSIPDSVGNCASLLEDPCIQHASFTWDASSPPSMHVRLSLQNSNDSALSLRNWTSRLMLHGVAVATADVVPGPIELAPHAVQDLELTFRFDSRALNSWWPRHVSSCELSPVATTVQFVREHVVHSPGDPNATDEAEPAPGNLVVDERQWTLPGQALTTGFVCTRT
jgi:LEA14-like dessication related protein